MKRHASMNRAYRFVWNYALNAWVAVAETARGRGKGAGRKLIALALPLFSIAAQAEPTGGQVVSGSGSISQSGAVTTINQSSQNLSLNWQSFNIAPSETVNFVQPSAAAIAVNRIFDTNGTQILGHLNANGQVYLINPNGILFGQGAQVNVGGLIASTLDLNDATLNDNVRSFAGGGKGSVINQGTINAADGGYVALLGNTVSNQGVITARLGTVALGAGSAATLTFNGNSLLRMQVDQSTLNNLAENRKLIQADGGQVIMSAGAKDALLASVVNNTGVIEARTVENRNGTIILQGGMAAGTVHVDGRLDASAPDGGNGGFIETSAAHVTVADSASVTTLANGGNNGTWLIDPVDFTIAASGGDMTGAAVGTALAGGNFTVMSTAGATGTSGDINVNDVVSWSANKLTLNAQNNININADLNGSGSASLALEYGQGAVAVGNTGTYSLNNGAQVNLPAGNNFSTKLGSDGVVKNYTVITDLGAAGSTTRTDLQGIKGSLAGNYVLGSNIDASATSAWNGGMGFEPLGTGGYFTGTFDGLGHVISNLTINRPTANNIGLFGQVSVAAIRNVGLVGGNVSGNYYVGGLAGLIINSTVSDSYATGNVSGAGNYVGGLLGLSNNNKVSNSYATGSVSGINVVGGLVGGSAFDTISRSYTDENVTGPSNFVGGLVGHANNDNISNSYAIGSVNGGGYVGGLVGSCNNSTVSNSYATSSVVGGSFVGGLVGVNNFSTVNNSYWDVTTSGQSTSAGGTGYTTAQMQQQSNFASWDFTNTWIGYDGYTNPLLRPFMTALTVTANDVTKTYDTLAYTGSNGVTYSSTPGANLFGSLSYSGSSQNAKNAGSYSITPSGLYSNQQGYIINYVDGTLTIAAADLAVTGVTANNKTYDATTAATLGGTAAVAAFTGDAVTLGGAGSGVFDTKDVGTGKAVTVTGYTLSGADAGNYNLLQPSGITADITPATLLYLATPVSIITGQVLPTLSGAVNGFVGGETLAVSTTGTLTWATDAVLTSPPGTYFINGSGLSAQNYVFAQDVGNATALTIKPAAQQPFKSATPRSFKNVTAQMQSGTLYPRTPVPPAVSSPIHQVTLAYSTSADDAALQGSDGENNMSAEMQTDIWQGNLTLRVVDGGVKLPSDSMLAQGGDSKTVHVVGLDLPDTDTDHVMNPAQQDRADPSMQVLGGGVELSAGVVNANE